MTEQCSLCRYFRLNFEKQSCGDCRRFPPFGNCDWPLMETTAWCGEFLSAVDAEKKEDKAILLDANGRFVPNCTFLAPDSSAPCAHQINKTVCEDCEEYHHPSGKCKNCNGGTLYQLAKHLEPKIPVNIPSKCPSCKYFMKPDLGYCNGCFDHSRYQEIPK